MSLACYFIYIFILEMEILKYDFLCITHSRVFYLKTLNYGFFFFPFSFFVHDGNIISDHKP